MKLEKLVAEEDIWVQEWGSNRKLEKLYKEDLNDGWVNLTIYNAGDKTRRMRQGMWNTMVQKF
jgi:hypothetical protein